MVKTDQPFFQKYSQSLIEKTSKSFTKEIVPKKNIPHIRDLKSAWAAVKEEILVNLKGIGRVNHSKEAPFWEIPGFCYLAVITEMGLKTKIWPSYPTVWTVSHFHYKYRRHDIDFVVEDTDEGNYHIHLNPKGGYAYKSWKQLDHLANSSLSYKNIGGEGLTSSIKTLDGTNYQEWAQKMEAYLQTQELWQYINGTSTWPDVPSTPIIP